MLKKLLSYNWNLFRNSLSGAKILVLIIYGFLLALILSQVLGTIYLIVTLQSTKLSLMFEWYTPERGRFILLAFANILWLAQFFFTNIRLMKLEENRKLLSMGYPLTTLARHLTLLAFAHPMNLLFNALWFIFLMLQFGHIQYVPLALAIVMTNFGIIFSLKFRVLTIIKNYQKWLLLLILTLLLIAGVLIDEFFSQSFFLSFTPYLHAINRGLSLFPGGVIAEFHTLSFPLILQLGFVMACCLICYFLHRDHIRNTQQGLQAHPGQTTPHRHTSQLSGWLRTQFGNHAGKYLYYVLTHPYNKIQGLLFVVFPILYVPFLLARMEELGSSKFILLFFFMYAPMGFQLIFLGNMFGYEHRELLKEMQFPVSFSEQLYERFRGALIIPMTLLVIISSAEFIILAGVENLFSVLLGNILIFEIFLGIFLWSTFYRFKKVKWISFSFSQPVISQSVQFVTGFAMFALSALFYISYGPFEFYKQLTMIILIILSGFWIFRFINNIQDRFTDNITPDLWTEL